MAFGSYVLEPALGLERRTDLSSWLGGGVVSFQALFAGGASRARPDPDTSAFLKRLYRRHRLGRGRLSPVAPQREPEGLIPTPDGSGLLEYVTVQSAIEEADVAHEGWVDLAVLLARRRSPRTT